MQEEWRPVVGYEGIYECSDLGRVRSVDRIDGNGHSRKGKILKELYTVWGYQIVTLCSAGVVKNKTIHSMIAEAFLGARGSGLVVDHIDNNRTNNRVENLQYITQRKNTTKDKKQRSLPTGVIKTKAGRYAARRKLKGEKAHLGTFDTPNEASEVYQRAIRQI